MLLFRRLIAYKPHPISYTQLVIGISSIPSLVKVMIIEKDGMKFSNALIAASEIPNLYCHDSKKMLGNVGITRTLCQVNMLIFRH